MREREKKIIEKSSRENQRKYQKKIIKIKKEEEGKRNHFPFNYKKQNYKTLYFIC